MSALHLWALSFILCQSSLSKEAFMRENSPSSTAQIVALMRAVLSSPAIALVDDPYAKSLLRPSYQLVSQALQGVVGRLVLGAADFGGAGVVSLLAGRTRFFDDAIKRAQQRGFRQVVLLGAGYDARALRLAHDRVQFFEVDHPATQADKRRKIENLGNKYPAKLISVDFTKDRLQERILQAGFNTEEPTFFLWEGVIMYLSEDQVRGTLRALRELAAPQSQLSFDCVRKGVTWLDEAVAKLGTISFAGLFGEPLDFRCDPDFLEQLLSLEGWKLHEIAGIEELHRRYLSGGPMRTPRDIAFVALAERSE
jgi:methyltransferase (TIGR00027 family)